MIGPTIEETQDFIIHAHGEQMRRGDKEYYYTHPIAVAEIAKKIAKVFCIPDEVLYNIERTSLLHDVVEDTPVTIEMLGKMGYPISVLNSVYLVSREEGETHKQSVDGIIASGDVVALIVKAADTYHNSIFTPEDVVWGIANGYNPQKDHERYMGSHKRLLEALAIHPEIISYVTSAAEGLADEEKMLAWNPTMQERIATDPEFKALWDARHIAVRE